MSRRVAVSGNYQYSEANAKEAYMLRSFGWLVGKRSEHENKKGEKVYTIRRDLQIAGDPVIRKAEKQFEQFNTKAQKTMKRRHGWGQFFAILFMVVGILAGNIFFLKGVFAPIDGIVDTLNDMIKNIVDPIMKNAEISEMIVEYVPCLFLAIGGISFISILINSARYKKRSSCPKRTYAKKYNSIARGALKKGADRLYLLKRENGALMTQSDRRMNELGMTMRRVLDNGEDYE